MKLEDIEVGEIYLVNYYEYDSTKECATTGTMIVKITNIKFGNVYPIRATLISASSELLVENIGYTIGQEGILLEENEITKKL